MLFEIFPCPSASIIDFLLKNEEGIFSVKEIARKTKLHAIFVERRLGELEKMGIVKKVNNSDDFQFNVFDNTDTVASDLLRMFLHQKR